DNGDVDPSTADDGPGIACMEQVDAVRNRLSVEIARAGFLSDGKRRGAHLEFVEDDGRLDVADAGLSAELGGFFRGQVRSVHVQLLHRLVVARGDVDAGELWRAVCEHRSTKRDRVAMPVLSGKGRGCNEQEN